MASRRVVIRLPELFPHQAEFLACTKRYAIACSGTKAGKTAAGAVYAIKRLLDEPGCAGTWIAPTFAQAVGVGLETVKALLPAPHVKMKMSPPSLTIGDSMLEFKSGEVPDNLFGPRRDFAVLDEAGRLSEDAWNAVRSTLTFTSGPARLLSNPSARTGWFFRLYTRGLDPDEPDVRSFRWKTEDNPLIPPAEIEDARRNLSERTFRSLYLGEFLDVGGSVFRSVRDCATGCLKAPEAGRRYVGGLDLARLADWTVLTILDAESGEMVGWERWHGVSWDLTVSRVAEIAKRYHGARVNVDSTGLGDPVLESLERCGVNVEGVRFSSTSKAQMVERLAGLMERRRISFPPLDVLIGELEAFEGQSGPTGTVRYSAPSGATDDAVCSLMLACKDLEHVVSSGPMVALPRPPRPQLVG